MKVYVVLRQETEWQTFIGVYSTKEKASESSTRNGVHNHPAGPDYHTLCDLCLIVETEVDQDQK